jgi:cytochrome c553
MLLRTSRQRGPFPRWDFLFALPLLAACSLAQADATELVTRLCVSCHGEGGNSSAPAIPRLAGQQADHIAKQLEDFISGKRENAAMAPFLAQIQAADITGLATYYAEQTPSGPRPRGNKKAVAAGKRLYEDGNTRTDVPACFGCHQPEGAGNHRYPRLAGQHAAYTLAQMKQFKAGTRSNDKARIMRAVAARMSEAEMVAVSEYLATLP